MTLVSVFLLVCAVLFTAAMYLGAVHLRVRRRRSQAGQPRAHENTIDVTVYAYDAEVNGLDDIKARHISVYRDTGVITGIEDESPVYRESLPPTTDNNRELNLLVRSAAEVKRVTDKTVDYFFNRIKPLNIKSDSIRVIYNSICCGLNEKRPMVLRMTRSPMEETE